jgi:hypothetical protein
MCEPECTSPHGGIADGDERWGVCEFSLKMSIFALRMS